MELTGCVTVHVTTPDEETAVEIVKTIVGERLAACASISGPIRSIYHWDGRVNDETEYEFVAKTTAALFDSLAARIRQLHPYKVPQIIATPITAGTTDYIAWIAQSTGGDA